MWYTRERDAQVTLVELCSYAPSLTRILEDPAVGLSMNFRSQAHYDEDTYRSLKHRVHVEPNTQLKVNGGNIKWGRLVGFIFAKANR